VPFTLNLWVAWIGILLGVLAGVVMGIFFHRDDWLGGYSSWSRRLLRLGHISFFGIAFLNIAFALSVPAGVASRPLACGGIALALAEFLMPGVCFLSAWRKPLRGLFFLPVACILAGIIGLLIGRIAL